VTSSTNAKIVKITSAVVVPIQERGLGTFSQPKCAAQAFTADGAKDRNPAKNPIKSASSRTCSFLLVHFVDEVLWAV
jgi:hypothetical protein